MRIIAGEYRSRRLFTPPDGEVTRPIPDRVKESLFAILRGHIEGSEVFDGFAGTGSVGLEAISRGAKRVVFVEQNRNIAQILKKNIDNLGAGDRAELVQGDVLGIGAISRCPRPVRVVFLDPPYPLSIDPLGWRRITSAMQELAKNLTDDGFIIVRTPWPFFEAAPEPEAAAAPKPKGKWKKEKKDRWSTNDWQGATEKDSRRTPKPHEGRGKKVNPSSLLSGSARDAEDPFGEEWEEIDPAEEEITEEIVEPVAGAAPVVEQIPVSMKIPGLKGPETHVYRQTGVHLYMRE